MKNQREIDRFWSKVSKSDSCWTWTAGKDKDGYGKIKFDGRHERTHRVSWRLHYGAFPRHLLVLHRCDNPSCVNPTHLFLGTARDNARDMSRKGRQAEQSVTHCPHGHEYTPENTRISVNRAGYRMRVCRACGIERSRQGYARNREERIANAVAYAKQRYEADPEAARARSREYTRAYRARKRAATHSSLASTLPQQDAPRPAE